jgi:hypothetical protein
MFTKLSVAMTKEEVDEMVIAWTSKKDGSYFC